MLDFPLIRRIARREESIPAGELLAVGLFNLIHSWKIWAVHLMFA
jgi:hypothetical protein